MGMEREQRRRRRLGVSGVTSLSAHVAVVIACLFGTAPHYDRLKGRDATDAAVEAVIDFDLVPPAQAAPALPEAPVPPPVIPRRGHTVRRARPAAEVPIRLPVSSDLITPPDVDDDNDDDASEGDEPSEAPPPAIAPAPPAPRAALSPAADAEAMSIPGHEATYLRTYETYPSLPRSLWVSGRVYAVLAQVCVSADGRVSNVSILRGAAAELDRAVTSTLRSWQYRPRIIEGTPRPFCHLVKLEFTLR
jgi:TonB family protein